TIAIGPIAAVVVIGIATSMALSALDEHYGITDRVIAGLDDIGNSIEGRIDQVKQNLYRNMGELADSIFDYAVESAKSVLIDAAKHTIDKFLTGRPRLQ